MRGWSAIFVGFLLLALAVWSFAWGGFNSSTLMCATAAAFCFLRGAQGIGIGEVGDPTALVDFVTDPADAIVDSAVDRLSEWFQVDEPNSTAAKQERFDPDAAVARYLAQRAPDPDAAPSIPAPVRSFGRKAV